MKFDQGLNDAWIHSKNMIVMSHIIEKWAMKMASDVSKHITPTLC